MFGSQRIRLTIPIVLAALAGAGCTEVDENVFDEIGATRLLLIDPGQQVQSVSDPDGRIQFAEWDLTRADLDLDGTTYDLLFGDSCTISDSVALNPVADGACRGGLTVEAGEQVQLARLTLTFTMVVRRARPVFLSVGGDFDGDGFSDDGDLSGSAFDNPCAPGKLVCDDNCPLVRNPDQADDDGDGLGNACSLFDIFSGLTLLDSDGDGVPDGSDNCVWIANPDQADRSPVSDGIGDACVEQEAVVEMGGTTEITLELGPDDLVQPFARVSFMTTDFDNRVTLDCDWDSSVCRLDAAGVEFCALENPLGALGGC